LEEWNIGIMGKQLKSVNPIFHRSIIPGLSLVGALPLADMFVNLI
jgi:hypothetical protein